VGRQLAGISRVWGAAKFAACDFVTPLLNQPELERQIVMLHYSALFFFLI
jgi:hypothetical protein